MNESSIYAKLEFLRDQFIVGKLKPCVDAELKLDEQVFSINVWREAHEKGELVVFMLGIEKCITSNKYCLGLIIAKDETLEFLNNEQLWGMGIP
jgi:hypothetical protein